jgi:sugar phosphate isomerase/epimerase
MKLSISNLFWEHDDNDYFYHKLNSLSIKYLEIAPKKTFLMFPKLDKNLTKNYLRDLKVKFNLKIVSLQSIMFGETANLFHSKFDRNYLYNLTKDIIDFASYIECENIVFGNPKNRDGYNKIFENEAHQFFYSLGCYAKEKKVILSIEPNPVIYNTNFLNSNIETLDFIKKVNQSHIRMNLDIGSMIYNNESIDSLIGSYELINHIHISEPYLKEIKFRTIHKDLNRLNFKKFISIETLNINDLAKIESMVNYLRSVLNFED